MGGALKRSVWLIAALVGACCAPAFAYDDDIEEARTHFRTRLRAKDFQGIELTYAMLKREQRRSVQGEYIPDLYLDFSEIPRCFWTAAQTKPDAESTALAGRCDQYYGGLMEAWKKAHPTSWVPYLGQIEISMAKFQWLKIEDAGLQKAFQSVPERARDILWYVQFLQAAAIHGWGASSYKEQLDQGISKYAAHPQLYRAAVRFHFPSNGGSVAEVENFARSAMDKAPRPDGLVMYLHIYDEVVSGEVSYPEWVYAKNPDVWSTMHAGLQLLTNRYPSPWNLTRYAQHACLAGDMPTLKKLLARIKPGEGDKKPVQGWMWSNEEAKCRTMASRYDEEERREGAVAAASR